MQHCMGKVRGMLSSNNNWKRIELRENVNILLLVFTYSKLMSAAALCQARDKQKFVFDCYKCSFLFAVLEVKRILAFCFLYLFTFFSKLLQSLLCFIHNFKLFIDSEPKQNFWATKNLAHISNTQTHDNFLAC